MGKVLVGQYGHAAFNFFLKTHDPYKGLTVFAFAGYHKENSIT
jgi:hypothetical protein